MPNESADDALLTPATAQTEENAASVSSSDPTKETAVPGIALVPGAHPATALVPAPEQRPALVAPTTEECISICTRWDREAQSTIDRSSKNIEQIEETIKKTDDALLVRSIRTQLAGGVIAISATLLAYFGLLGPATVGAIIASLLTIDGPLRSSFWRKRKLLLETVVTQKKAQHQEWLREKISVENALRGYKRELEIGLQFPASTPNQLPPGRRKRRRRRKNQRR